MTSVVVITSYSTGLNQGGITTVLFVVCRKKGVLWEVLDTRVVPIISISKDKIKAGVQLSCEFSPPLRIMRGECAKLFTYANEVAPGLFENETRRSVGRPLLDVGSYGTISRVDTLY